jgi:battenin
MPRTPSSVWTRHKARIASAFEGCDPRVFAAFWLFGMIINSHTCAFSWSQQKAYTAPLGLINNVLYVIILSAALDLVGPSIPKGVVLLADVMPSFFTKLTAPYYIHAVPYSLRILIFVALSTGGMLLIALTPASMDSKTIGIKMFGVVLASLSSGGGELSFLGLTHFYGHFSLAAWGSGTGGAGLVGAGVYVIATDWIGLSVRTSLLLFSFLPVIMLVSFFVVLPRAALNKQGAKFSDYERVANGEGDDGEGEDRPPGQGEEESELLESSMYSSRRSFTSLNESSSKIEAAWKHLRQNLNRSKALFFP